MPAQRSTVSMWESGKRGRKAGASLATVERIAARLTDEAEHFTVDHATAMAGMWQSACCLEALAPRTVWFHNFAEPPGPVWAWLRTSGSGCADHRAVLAVGPFDMDVLVPDGPGGVIVHAPTSVPNPSLKVTFAEPGWVDCGSGVVPGPVAMGLGVVLIDARSALGRQSSRPRLLDAQAERELRPALSVIREVAARFEVSWSLVAPHIGDTFRPSRTVHALQADSVEPPSHLEEVTTDNSGALVSRLTMPPRHVRTVREGRGMSRAAAAERATEFDQIHPLKDRDIEGLELAGRIPPARCALARLDMVYGTGGHLGIDRTFDSRAGLAAGTGRYRLAFPAYWQGPIWLQVNGPATSDVCTVDMAWGPWGRRQHTRSGTVLTTRKATIGATPLLVRLPKGWHLTAGTGVVPTALDVNADWRPINLWAALAVVRDSVEAIAKALPYQAGEAD